MPLDWTNWQKPDDPPLKPGSLDHIGGRKPLPDAQKRKRRVEYLTDAEWEEARLLVDRVKAKHRGGK